MRSKILYIILILLSPNLISCQKTINLNLPAASPEIVVEGHIQNGTTAYVILSNNASYFSTYTIADIANIFVHGALITVSNGTQTDTLHEVSFDTSGVLFYTYKDESANPIIGQVGKSYSLYIKVNGKVLTSVTTIPQLTPLDSIWYEPAARANYDSLVVLMARYVSPQSVNVYIRYFTEIDNQGFYPDFTSVYSNQLFYGKTFDFSLNSGINRGDTSSNPNYPYFKLGDTITVEWCNIDQAQFNFWNTLDYEQNNQGNPFANPVVIASNITGGLGIWGGYGATYKTLIVPK